MAVFDIMPFSHEVDLLLLRMGIMDPYVDYFVISEATTTFSGLDKPLRFAETRGLYAQYDDKIIYNAVTERFEGSTFERDRFQKDSIKMLLMERCSPDDLLIFSDVDEIPRPETLDHAFSVARSGRMAHFAQELYIYYLNLVETSGRFPSITGDYPGVRKSKWLGSRAVTPAYLAPYSVTELRDPSHKAQGERITNGGWHFSYCGGEIGQDQVARVERKVRDFAHQELVTDSTLKRLPKKVGKLKEPLGRRGAKLKVVPLDDSYPTFLLENLEAFGHMVLDQ